MSANRRKPSRKASQKQSAGSTKPIVWIAIVALAGVVIVGVVAGGGTTTPQIGTADPDTLSIGEELFLGNCAECHGSDLSGTNTGPPFLNAIYAPNHHGDEAFQRAVATGVQPHHWSFGPMAPIEGLTRDDDCLRIAVDADQHCRLGEKTGKSLQMTAASTSHVNVDTVEASNQKPGRLFNQDRLMKPVTLSVGG